MIVAIHQPNYIPWLGYFYKIAHCDMFVLLDDAQYTKNSFINRNRIKTPTGEQWLTIPVRTAGRFGGAISQITTELSQRWPAKHLNSLHANYRRAPYFEEVIALLEPVYRTVTQDTLLANFNGALIQVVATYMGVTTPIVRSSELGVETQSTERLVDITQTLAASEYLSGKGGMTYQDETMFAEHGIRLTYSDYASEPYPQLWSEFLPGMSVIDALMNMGQSTRDVLFAFLRSLSHSAPALSPDRVANPNIL